MKKSLLVAGIGMFLFSQQADAQLALETFNSGLPSTWSMIKVDNNLIDPAALAAPIPATLNVKAWMTRLRAAGDSAMLTASVFAPPGRADRWLVTPQFMVNDPNMIIEWEDWESAGAQYNDSIQVWVSTTGGATPASFTTKIYDGPATGFDLSYGKHGASLGAFNGQNIKVAFRNNTYQQGALRIDNVKTSILPARDIALSGVTPSLGHPLSYGLANSNITLGGSVSNLGAQPVTSFVVNYQQGSNPVVSQTISGVNIGVFGTHSFTISTPFVLPSTVADYPIKMWVELASDVNTANDTMNTSASTAAFKPNKRLHFEEATGTWCGWCPRGAVYMDSLWKTHNTKVSLVAVHNGPNDPMVLAPYDNWMGTIGPTLTSQFGYPAVVIDRRELRDPSEVIDVVAQESNYFGFAEITLGAQTISGGTLTLPVTVKPAVNLNGDYRLVMVVTENHVHGTTSGYAQVNYYSGLPSTLVGANMNWNTAPDPVPALSMNYDFVARAVVPSVLGGPGTLPTSMAYNSTYNYTFTAPINSAWDTKHIHAVVMLIRGSDGVVLNSSSELPEETGISNVSAGLTEMNVYPNPAKDYANVTFGLTDASSVQVQLINAMGQVVYSAEKKLAAGSQSLVVPTSNVASGIYNIKVQTEKGSLTQRVSVIK